MSSAASGRPPIREILSGQVLQGTSGSGMTDHDIADLLGPLSALGSSAMFYGTMKAGQAFGTRLGLKSGKSEVREYAAPYSTVVLAMALGIQRTGYPMRAAYDTPDGSVIECTLPPDLMSLAGEIDVEIVERAAGRVAVTATCEIKGQMFDWGKSKRALDGLFTSADGYLRRIGGQV